MQSGAVRRSRRPERNVWRGSPAEVGAVDIYCETGRVRRGTEADAVRRCRVQCDDPLECIKGQPWAHIANRAQVT